MPHHDVVLLLNPKKTQYLHNLDQEKAFKLMLIFFFFTNFRCYLGWHGTTNIKKCIFFAVAIFFFYLALNPARAPKHLDTRGSFYGPTPEIPEVGISREIKGT